MPTAARLRLHHQNTKRPLHRSQNPRSGSVQRPRCAEVLSEARLCVWWRTRFIASLRFFCSNAPVSCSPFAAMSFFPPPAVYSFRHLAGDPRHDSFRVLGRPSASTPLLGGRSAQDDEEPSAQTATPSRSLTASAARGLRRRLRDYTIWGSTHNVWRFGALGGIMASGVFAVLNRPGVMARSPADLVRRGNGGL